MCWGSRCITFRVYNSEWGARRLVGPHHRGKDGTRRVWSKREKYSTSKRENLTNYPFRQKNYKSGKHRRDSEKIKETNLALSSTCLPLAHGRQLYFPRRLQLSRQYLHLRWGKTGALNTRHYVPPDLEDGCVILSQISNPLRLERLVFITVSSADVDCWVQVGLQAREGVRL